MENSHKETNLLCIKFTKVELVFVGNTQIISNQLVEFEIAATAYIIGGSLVAW